MLRPRIKRALQFSVYNDRRIQLGFFEFMDDDDRVIEFVIEMMDGTRSFNEVVAAVLLKHPSLDTRSIAEVISRFINLGLVEDAAGAPPPELTKRELERYSRGAEYFAIMDEQQRSSPYEVQGRLKNSSVCVLGVGGTGSSVALSLAMSGVGSLHVADFDLIEESNLNRQVLFCEADIGMSKVTRAVERLRQVNSNVVVTGEELQVTCTADIVPLMKRCDVFVLCADRPVEVIQQWTNEAALQTGRTWFFALSRGANTSVGGFEPHKTSCHECAAEHLRRRRKESGFLRSWDPDEAPAVPAVTPMATLSAALCSFDVLHYLGGVRTQLLGVEINLSLHDFTKVDRVVFERLPDCTACGPHDPTR